MTTTNNYFKNCIGQEQVKETLGIYLDAYKQGRVLPHLLAIAPKGVGKTHFCRAFADHLGKPIMEINGGYIKSPKQVAQQLFAEIMGKEVTLFIDECHDMPRSVETMFLTVLNKEASNKTTISYDDMVFEFDFSKLTVLMATTERQNIFAPLLDRLEEISFSEYTSLELQKILMRHCKGVKFNKGALEELCRHSRGNARWGVKTGAKLENYCAAKGIDTISFDDIAVFNKTMGIFELGLSQQEVNLLKILLEYPSGATLKVMCARSGNTSQAQQDMEKYPQKHGLLEIDGKRKITRKGINYLKGLEGNG